MAAHLITILLLTTIHHSAGDERSSLLSFLAGLAPHSVLSLTDWNTSPNLCNWTGVSCHHLPPWQRVAKLDLSGRNIHGKLSPFLSNLSSLEVLDLSNNFLTGPIPAELGSLSGLKQLSLSSNLFSGTIPFQLGFLNLLVYLDLGGNQLTGQIPSTLFCNYSRSTINQLSLQYIDLSNNSLTGEIPLPSNDLCLLDDLRYLLLWSNQLSGSIPPALSNSSQLEWIDFESNNLSGGLPLYIFNNMPYLQFLSLSFNNLSTDDLNPFFTSLSNCSGLQELELAGNGLRGELPPSIGDLSVNLLQLHLEQNQITGPIHPNISNLVNLTYLNLSNNVFNGSIPPEISRLCRLERFYLSNNRLTGKIPPSFGKILQLGLLDVSDNELSGSIPDSFAHLPQFRRLLLNGNRLSGQIPPSLGNCINLEILDLSYNQLTGEIPPEIAGLQSLKLYLNLSNNNLHGHLPLEMSKMDMILALDLSCNNLSGMIPSQIGSCVALEYLNLSKNSFVGHLPSSIGALPYLKVLDLSSNKLAGAMPESLEASSTLRYLNVSFNNFSGVIPGDGVFKSLGGSSFFGNPWLCGYNIDGITECRTEPDHRLGRLIRISLSVSGAVIVLVIMFFIACQMMMRRRSSSPKVRLPSFSRSVFEDMDSMEDFVSNYHDYPRLSYQQLVEATNGFADTNLIGSGRFGRVYKGNLRTSTKIAVKVLDQMLDCSATQLTDSFKRECEVLKRTKHRNLIKIVTACSRPDFKALVLPLMPNGSLERWLYQTKPVDLSLELVVRLLSDVAEGMAYLHHYSPVRVVHCDLKPSNVLLDGDMTALVADFGIARLVKGVGDGGASGELQSLASCISTSGLLHGSVGYIAPEYGLGGHPSTQGDVYSFGVLLLEMITGTRPTDIVVHEGHNLHEWVKNHYPNNIESIIPTDLTLNLPSLAQHDPFYHNKLKRTVISELVELGLVCTQYSPSMRPTMIDVAHEMAILKQDISRLVVVDSSPTLPDSSSDC
ncbi:putative leucine-rich repeat receptor-like serine/threonine-protein kinase At2g24130 [Phalaenopsis equestris]|uniref:putative leucine-rich repeat receptor-like serine/threonine-protein kinase At2g24130 n=1 Tax=Phalaenopsis equestris TaxID=78828 RepID=UPI0009E26ED3|nr:putative leucine-rich repeat receptor-like serine/threonine-protein kinase At2g24130 [Phalaenopsis equestris]